MTELSELISRLEKAEGASRELDGEIHIACGLAGDHARSWGPYLRRKMPRPEYTASIDAAFALAEKLLPKWSIRVGVSEGYKSPVVTMGRSYPTNRTVAVEGSTIPTTVCLAILKALQEQGT